MSKNMSERDRAIRAGVGVVMIIGCFTWPHTIWGMLGIVPFATAVMGTCPLYRLFGFSTRPPG